MSTSWRASQGRCASQLRDRGAVVYAAARNPAAVDQPGVTPIALNVTEPASVAARFTRTSPDQPAPGVLLSQEAKPRHRCPGRSQ
jgi:hypothetical protein